MMPKRSDRSTRRLDTSRSPAEYYARMPAPPAAAVAWSRAGTFFSWRSTLPENAGRAPLQIFTRSLGNPDQPAILLVHGYPTSSFDFAALAGLLGRDFHVLCLDTPGYGFSDKPRDGYRYSILDDARLVDHFLREVARVSEVALLTHDKGDSVGLALLGLHQAAAPRPYRITHHFITNGNIYLPLAQLTVVQKLLLHPRVGPWLSSVLRGKHLAKAMGRATYTPHLRADEVAALASNLRLPGRDRHRARHHPVPERAPGTRGDVARDAGSQRRPHHADLGRARRHRPHGGGGLRLGEVPPRAARARRLVARPRREPLPPERSSRRSSRLWFGPC